MERIKAQININKDVAIIKKEQLAELSKDSQHQIQKTINLLWFFGAVSAIVFSQESLYNIPWPYLWIIFSIILAFLIVCIMSFQWKKVNSMVNVGFWEWDDEIDFLKKEIEQLEKCKTSLNRVIKWRNDLNKIGSILFSTLILIYAFIFLIYNPMTDNTKVEITKNSDLQMHQEEVIQPSQESSNQESWSNNQQTITIQEVIKTAK